ncbi:MAG TPA: sensor histidine kinase, partial [Burkholderiales bacterium]|nr:sensor histidine kinase [Burkholderiales bacterium]
MLHEFVTSNRDELARRCRARVGARGSPCVAAAGLQHGVPLVLEQLVWALRSDKEGPSRNTPAIVEVSRTAALHGKELREQGY